MANETTADIIAEMCDEGRTGESSCLEWVGAKMRDYADRLEAAHRRERGDCAKLREALEFIKQYFDKIDPFNINTYTFSQIEVEHINEAIDAALAAPPRNCDVSTVKELNVRYDKFCYAHRSPENGCGGCPLNGEPCCELAWAQMPYEEGGDEVSEPTDAAKLRDALLAIREAHDKRETPHDILVCRIIDDALKEFKESKAKGEG